MFIKNVKNFPSTLVTKEVDCRDVRSYLNRESWAMFVWSIELETRVNIEPSPLKAAKKETRLSSIKVGSIWNRYGGRRIFNGVQKKAWLIATYAINHVAYQTSIEKLESSSTFQRRARIIYTVTQTVTAGISIRRRRRGIKYLTKINNRFQWEHIAGGNQLKTELMRHNVIRSLFSSIPRNMQIVTLCSNIQGG